MHAKALLDRATELLRELLRFEMPADAAVSAFTRRHRAFGPRERQALAETAYAVLRQRRLFEHLAQGGSGSLERRLAIVGWQGDRHALEAALPDAERQWLAAARAIDQTGLPDAMRHNLPDWLASALRDEMDESSFQALAAALLQPAALDLRVNLLKAKRIDVMQALQAADIVARPTPYSSWGLRIEGRAALQELELFRHGAFEVQDEGSQLLALLVQARRGEMVVDFCAGAGGKTLALGAAMRNAGRLYAFDTSGHRLDAMKPRLARAGLTNVHLVQLAHEDDKRVLRLAGKIDRVLVDAPCSGLGTLRRNPDLKWRQTPQTIAVLCERQRAILAAAARLVKPGGRLVYGTCSLLAIENEAVAHHFEAMHPQFRLLDIEAVLKQAGVAAAADLVTARHLRLWPHRHATDGFFAAVWQRE